jgi:hypothetical protein
MKNPQTYRINALGAGRYDSHSDPDGAWVRATAAFARIRELEAALLRHGHKDGACGLCSSLSDTAEHG